MFNIIVATSKNNVIGNNNSIPWNYKEDLKYFRKITTSNNGKDIIIMGNNTWKSIGRVLSKRVNIVLSRKSSDVLELKEDNLYFSNDFDKLLLKLNEEFKEYNIYVIGGQKIYELALNHPQCNKIYFTKIKKEI